MFLRDFQKPDKLAYYFFSELFSGNLSVKKRFQHLKHFWYFLVFLNSLGLIKERGELTESTVSSHSKFVRHC